MENSTCSEQQFKKVHDTLLKYINTPLNEEIILSLPVYFHALLGGGSIDYLDNGLNYGVTCSYKQKDCFVIMFNGYNSNLSEFVIFDFLIVERKENDNKTLSYQVCNRDGKHDPLLISLVENHDKEYHEPAHLAWRVNVKTKRLVSVTPKGIKCGNEGW